jgi:hypothetical protein
VAETEQVVIWRPQAGPQHSLLKCPVFEIFFGGARGGGKTDGMIGGDWPIHAQRYGQYAKGVFFRRELPQLDAAIARSKEIYNPLGADWNEQKKTWIFPNGASLKFRPLERDSDAEKYQGHDYTRVYFEELTNYPSMAPVMKIMATLRSGAGVPCGFRATGNPGGPGHNWVKERYIDPAPAGFEVIKEALLNPITGEMQSLDRVFIPSRLNDNRLMIEKDPMYVSRLQISGSKNLVKAWLEGDWSIVDGAYFDCWSKKMVLKPFEIPSGWLRFRSFDWGSAKPFSVGWWAVATDDYRGIPRGAMVRYREWYGAKKADVGLKLTANDVAQGIIERSGDEDFAFDVADPAIFTEDGGPSIAERMEPIYWTKADNKRTPGRGQMGGWDQMRQRMMGTEGVPMIYCFDTCKDSIRTIPVLQHDSGKPEDLDTTSEDHAADEWRYACMSRPWTKPEEPSKKPRDRWDKAFDDDDDENNWKLV